MTLLVRTKRTLHATQNGVGIITAARPSVKPTPRGQRVPLCYNRIVRHAGIWGLSSVGEHLLCKQGVRGSNPLASTSVDNGSAQKLLVRPMKSDSRDLMVSRSVVDIVQELERLSHQRGFVYTFAFNVFTSLFTRIDEVANIDWTERPNNQELSFLLGLMIKRPLDFTLPDTEVLYYQNDKALTLLQELHNAHAFVRSSQFTPAQADSVTFHDQTDAICEQWLESGFDLIEPIFYGSEGADAYQFHRLAELRYQNDHQWIENHLGTSVSSVIASIERIRELVDERLSSLQPSDSFAGLCKQLMEIFLFEPRDLTDVDEQRARAFFAAFSCCPGKVNKDLHSIGAYNSIHSHPILKLDNGKYFIPLTFYLSRSLYESPFYWMRQDNEYKDIADENRGHATEEIAHVFLGAAFGESNIYRNIKVRKNGKDETDIDLLVLYQDRAIVVQAKSKKLTIGSRMGNSTNLEVDFHKAVQEAYDQAVLSTRALADTRYELFDSNGDPFRIEAAPKESHIICVTGDHFPALAVQLRNFLRKSEDDPFPLAASLFDLEILAYYLSDPFQFLYYLRQRSRCSSHVGLCSELALLGFHIAFKLDSRLGREIFLIDETFAQIIEADYLVARGRWPESRKRPKLSCKWRDKQFDEVVRSVRAKSQPGLMDAIFFLYDIAGDQTRDFFHSIPRLQRATLIDGQHHDMSKPNLHERRGVSFISYPAPEHPSEEAFFQQHFRDFAISRKYKSYANEWMVLASIAETQNLIDMVWHSAEVWQDDLEIETIVPSVLSDGRVLNGAGRRRKRKPSRNDPCPCGSRCKFKRCHGR